MVVILNFNTMSVSLTCPNCGTVIGEASHEDNYTEKYYHKDAKGNPVCPACGDGSDMTFTIIGYFMLFLLVVTALIYSLS